MKTNLILINNDIVDAEEINVHPFNRGHQFGDGVYEIVPVYNGRPCMRKCIWKTC